MFSRLKSATLTMIVLSNAWLIINVLTVCHLSLDVWLGFAALSDFRLKLQIVSNQRMGLLLTCLSALITNDQMSKFNTSEGTAILSLLDGTMIWKSTMKSFKMETIFKDMKVILLTFLGVQKYLIFLGMSNFYLWITKIYKSYRLDKLKYTSEIWIMAWKIRCYPRFPWMWRSLWSLVPQTYDTLRVLSVFFVYYRQTPCQNGKLELTRNYNAEKSWCLK